MLIRAMFCLWDPFLSTENMTINSAILIVSCEFEDHAAVALSPCCAIVVHMVHILVLEFGRIPYLGSSGGFVLPML